MPGVAATGAARPTHGVAVLELTRDRIAHWREYQFVSELPFTRYIAAE